MTGIKKSNGYIGADKALELAQKQCYFERFHDKTGGQFTSKWGTFKINEKTFKIIQPHLKPRL